MPWYTVIKTIKGHQYLYLQTTYREGGKVKTKNKYLGRADDGVPFSMEPRPTDRIGGELEQASIARDILRDTLKNHRAKFFIKLRGDLAKQSVGGTSFAELNAQALEDKKLADRLRQEGKPVPINLARGRRQELLRNLDTYVSEHGFADFDEVDDAVAEYLSLKEQHDTAARTYARLKREGADAWNYHRAVGMGRNEESVIRPVREPKEPKRRAPTLKMRSPPVPKLPRAHLRRVRPIKLDKIRRLKPINWRKRFIALRQKRAQEVVMSFFRNRADRNELDYKNTAYAAYLKLRRR